MRVCASGLKVKGNWHVKCYTDECGVNRNCRATHHQKISNLLANCEIAHYSENATKFNTSDEMFGSENQLHS